jgi:hypothetical protein
MRNATYNGNKIEIDQDVQDDCIKLIHSFVTPDGQRVDVDLSPYSTDDPSLVAAMIDLGNPTRESINSIGPFRREDVERLWKEKFGERPMPEV